MGKRTVCKEALVDTATMWLVLRYFAELDEAGHDGGSGDDSLAAAIFDVSLANGGDFY